MMKKQCKRPKVTVATAKKSTAARFAVVMQKGSPALRRFAVSGCTSHPTGNGSFRNIETHHQKLSRNAGSAPIAVLCDHLEDQLSNLLRDLHSTGRLSHPREHAPVPAEPSPVPLHNCLRVDQNECFLPGGPKAAC